ncbi:hypothetical protein V2J09_011122 [Rumex salicifolius]
MALGAKLKLGFIDGSIAPPKDSSPDHTRWLRNDQMVACWIFNTMKPEIACSFFYTTSVRDVWLEILDRFSQGSASLRYQLKHESMRILQEYDSIKSQILATDPLPSLGKAYYMVLQVEKQRKISTTVQEPSAFMAGSIGSSRGDSRRKPKDDKKHCSICQKDGHLAETCFEVVGYPNWYKGKKSVRTGKVVANVSQDTCASDSPLDASMDSTAFLNLIHYKSLNNEWILDTGATDHMSPYVDQLSDLRNLSPPVVVRLPDGSVQKDRSSRTVVAQGQVTGGLYKLAAHFQDTGMSSNSKFHRLPFPSSVSRSMAIFDLLHMDLWGPFNTASLNGEKYFFTIVDDMSQATWTYLLHTKDQVYDIVKSFFCLVNTQFGKKPKIHGRDKMDARGVKCVLLGYPSNQKGYRVFDLANQRIVHSRDVVFYEDQFPFCAQTEQRDSTPLPSTHDNSADDSFLGVPLFSTPSNPVVDRIDSLSAESSTLTDDSMHIPSIPELRRSTRCRNMPPAVHFPLPARLKLRLDQGVLLEDAEQYRRLVDRLLYLSLTRPDLSYAVQHLSQFVSQPRLPHFQAAIHVLRYLKGSMHKGLFYPVQPSLKMTEDLVSLQGDHLLGTVSSWANPWCPGKQRNKPQLVEAEYRSMATTTSEIVWMSYLLNDLHNEVPLPITLFCDNKVAQQIAANPCYHERTKHLELDAHFVREKVQGGFMQTTYIHTSMQIVDIMTKALGKQAHELLSAKLGLTDLPT